ncbi:hypothetical protein RMSM_05926 [Rhodopirellula maiorica SM1]|uniref:Uncharacterized protein n=1 Tax=Rhodopirellula maiorica SM1 TaxID=1265738 RepID=M5RCM2_9BACT|nr:hypothetical protein RMSM_05926 [Rhodopirellula maiorica SM1]
MKPQLNSPKHIDRVIQLPAAATPIYRKKWTRRRPYQNRPQCEFQTKAERSISRRVLDNVVDRDLPLGMV